MPPTSLFFLAVAVLAFVQTLAAPGESSRSQRSMQGGPRLFIENIGQIRDQSGAFRHDVDYAVSLENATVYIGRGVLHYQFRRPTTAGPSGRAGFAHTYRMDVTLADALPGTKALATGSTGYFETFYAADKGLDGAVAHAFSRILYRDVYPGIDWSLYLKDGALEYDFIVHPGADPKQIRLCYDGAKRLQITKRGSLRATTPFGTIEENAPFAYEVEGGKTVPVAFRVTGKTATFKIAPPARTTVIDPAVRVWGTYYGDIYEDYAYGLASDSAGNVYLGGSTQGGTNIVTSGSHQTTVAGTTDAMLVKFNAAGVRLWATYYGGVRIDEIRDLAVDRSGNVYATGITESPAGIATPGAHRDTFTKTQGINIWDAFLVKFSSSGTRLWGTYYGDTLRDMGTAVVCDEAGNVYMGGETLNGTGISTPGSYQPGYVGADAFIAKFSPQGARIWGSYYGGNGIDNLNDLCYDPFSKRLYLAGQTNSSANIASPGAFQTSCFNTPGNVPADGFLMAIDTAGTRKWGTYYGSGSSDFTLGVAADGRGAIYTVGSYSADQRLVTAGAFNPVTYMSDAILARFDTGGIRQWATWVHGVHGYAVTTGAAGDVFISGGVHTALLIGTRGSFQPNPVGNVGNSHRDGFVMKFSPDGQRIWGSYYGTNNHEYATNIAYNNATNSVFFGGTTWTNGFPSSELGSAGAFRQSSPGGYSDGFVTRFANDTSAWIRLPFNDTLLCPGASLPIAYGADTFKTGNVFSIQLSNGVGSFSSGATIIGSVTATTAGVITCTVPATATPLPYYKIRVLATNPVDTSEAEWPDIRIGTPISGTTSASTNGPICAGDTLRLMSGFSGTGSITHYKWSGPANYSNMSQNPVMLRTDTSMSGTYFVTAMNGGCQATTDSVQVLVKLKPDTVGITYSTPVCTGDTLHFYGVTATPGAVVRWLGPNGFSDSGAHVYIPAVSTAAGGWYTAVATLNGCTSRQTQQPIHVLPSNGAPSVALTVSPGQSVPAGAPVTFTAAASNAGAAPAYEWRLNGLAVAGVTGSSYTTATLSDGDIVSVLVRSALPCPHPDTALSTSIAMHVSAGVRSTSFNAAVLAIYPSPNSGRFTLRAASNGTEAVLIKVLDLTGRTVFASSVDPGPGLFETPIALDKSMPPGIYTLRVVQGAVQSGLTFTVR